MTSRRLKHCTWKRTSRNHQVALVPTSARSYGGNLMNSYTVGRRTSRACMEHKLFICFLSDMHTEREEHAGTKESITSRHVGHDG